MVLHCWISVKKSKEALRYSRSRVDKISSLQLRQFNVPYVDNVSGDLKILNMNLWMKWTKKHRSHIEVINNVNLDISHLWDKFCSKFKFIIYYGKSGIKFLISEWEITLFILKQVTEITKIQKAGKLLIQYLNSLLNYISEKYQKIYTREKSPRYHAPSMHYLYHVCPLLVHVSRVLHHCLFRRHLIDSDWRRSTIFPDK